MLKSIEPNWPLSGRRPPPFRVSGDADVVVGVITSPRGAHGCQLAPPPPPA